LTATSAFRRWASARASGSSFPAVQRELIEGWARAHGARVLDVFEELDEPGADAPDRVLGQESDVEVRQISRRQPRRSTDSARRRRSRSRRFSMRTSTSATAGVRCRQATKALLDQGEDLDGLESGRGGGSRGGVDRRYLADELAGLADAEQASRPPSVVEQRRTRPSARRASTCSRVRASRNRSSLGSATVSRSSQHRDSGCKV
jgi:hypothetical protein